MCLQSNVLKMEVHKYYPQYKTLKVAVAIEEKCYAIEGKPETIYIKVCTLQKRICEYILP